MSAVAPQANRNREILDAIRESVCALDLNMTITFWNAAARGLYGWSRKEAIGQNLIELLKCEYDERLSSGLEELLNTGTLERRVYRHAKDGALLIVDGNWTLRRDPAGAPVEIIETTHRASTFEGPDESSAALLKAYQALAASEKKYRDLFNFMPIAIWQLSSSKMREMFDA